MIREMELSTPWPNHRNPLLPENWITRVVMHRMDDPLPVEAQRKAEGVLKTAEESGYHMEPPKDLDPAEEESP